jgi:ADP-heptose:LPS heptosyltransferase
MNRDTIALGSAAVAFMLTAYFWYKAVINLTESSRSKKWFYMVCRPLMVGPDNFTEKGKRYRLLSIFAGLYMIIASSYLELVVKQ